MGPPNHSFFQRNDKKHKEAEYLLNALPRTLFGTQKPQKSTKNQRNNKPENRSKPKRTEKADYAENIAPVDRNQRFSRSGDTPKSKESTPNPLWDRVGDRNRF